MRLRLIPSLLCAALLSVAACGGATNYHLPVDSPIKPFKAPSDDELTGQAFDPLAAPSDDDDDFEPVMPPDMKDKPNEKSGDDAAKPPASKTAPAPAAKPAAKPAPKAKAKPKAGKKG